MKLELLIVLLLKFEIFITTKAFHFQEITNDIFPLGEDTGVIAAFGHLNSDEFTDVISLQAGGTRLQLLKASESRPYFQTSLNCSFGNVINSVVPGDYNGDSVLDMLISLKTEKKNAIKILWGTNGTIDCKSDFLFELSSQPFIVDFDGDMIPDIIGEITNNDDSTERYVWISSIEKKFTKRNLTESDHQRFKSPQHSSGLIDLDNDMAPDILITGEKYIETWFNTGKEFIENNTFDIPYPGNAQWKWQSTFVDMNLDGKSDLLMPVCYDRKCDLPAVVIWNANLSRWENLTTDFRNPNDNTLWSFKLLMQSSLEEASLAATLRTGDVDMDGFPDFIIVLQSKKIKTDSRAFILKNVPCERCYSGRTIKILWDTPGLKDIPDVQIAAFFDLFEDGTLDVLVSTNTRKEWKIHALQNTEVFDSCFLKVLVLSGLCNHNCTTEAYGVNQPGPVVRYNMTTQEGQPLVSSLVQLSQSAHFPLQLPYSVFGLGETPNFIDILTVSIPASFDQSVHKREWIQIIPNSQIVIIPHPPQVERRWVKKLFVTPSHLVLLTCISLIGTCIFLCLLVALLHWRERREDKIERMQDACRFHFDAM